MGVRSFSAFRRVILALGVCALGVLACGGTVRRELILYPSETPNASQTPLVVQITTTPNATHTAIVVVVSETPNALAMCVTADEAVYLRPSPNADDYPIEPLTKGTKVLLTGGMFGLWVHVEVGVSSGWIRVEYLGDC